MFTYEFVIMIKWFHNPWLITQYDIQYTSYATCVLNVRLYGPITIGPHKFSLSLVFWLCESTNLSSFVRAMRDRYYLMTIIEISKKRILIGRIFHFRRCRKFGGTSWHHLIVIGLAVALADTFPPMIMEFPRANQMTSCASLLSFPKQQVVGIRWELTHQYAENHLERT